MDWCAKAFLKTASVALVFMATDKAQAECPEWAVTSKEINIGQSNNTELFLTFQQIGLRLKGTALHRKVSGKIERGLVNGSLQGSKIAFRITWQNGNSGFYQGEVNWKGRLSGVVDNTGNPAFKARWSSHDRQATCIRLEDTAQNQKQCSPGYHRRGVSPADNACAIPGELTKGSR